LTNVPGGSAPLFLNGAQMMGMFPVSALGGSIGLNVTLASYAGSMDFGFLANGMAMPDLPSLARHTGDAFAEPEASGWRDPGEAAVKAPRGSGRKRAEAKSPAGAPRLPAVVKKGRRGRRASAAKKA
jgi:hypothetical protein